MRTERGHQRGPRPSFGPGRGTPEIRGRVAAMVALLVASGGLLFARQGQQRRAQEAEAQAIAAEVIIEVRGDVPRPGYHAVPGPARISGALAAAGVDATALGLVDAGLDPGTRLVVYTTMEGELQVRLEPMDALLVVGLPVDINTASAVALDAIPGIGAQRAQAIVSERATGGPYGSVDALTRVHGIGPATVEAMRPFVTAVSPTGG